MDFKARFEGRQSFINKRGDLVDKSSSNVEPLMMPLQSPSKDSRQAAPLPSSNPESPHKQQPFLRFL